MDRTGRNATSRIEFQNVNGSVLNWIGARLDLDALLQHTNKSKLRAHSRTAWHTRTIEYAGRFTEFDLMWEGKDKNLGAAEIARHLTGAI